MALYRKAIQFKLPSTGKMEHDTEFNIFKSNTEILKIYSIYIYIEK